jgi:hypothetical protein
MQNFTYTKTASLTEAISHIDNLRTQLLLYPLSPADELKLQWEATLNRIYFEIALQGSLIPVEQINSYLSPLGSKIPHPLSNLIINLKHSYDYLYHNWIVNDNPVTIHVLADFYAHGLKGVVEKTDEEIINSLKYIQINPEHPIIQASLVELLILRSSLFNEYNEQFAHLTFNLFLYKNGYDMRRLVVFEEYHYRNLLQYKDMIMKLNRLPNITPWLEYCAKGIIESLEKTLQYVKSSREKATWKDGLFELADRQKSILNLFIQPNVKITNRMVQRKFRVSQITASRDLSKLSALGLIFALGKGRNTYYTKV